MAKQFILTDDGLKKLEAELDELKTVRRKEIADKIKVALSFGDLSENSEYDEAKNEQGKVENRIAELEAEQRAMRTQAAGSSGMFGMSGMSGIAGLIGGLVK